MLVSELNAQIPNDNCYYPIKSTNDTAYLDSAVDSNIPSGERVKHNLLKTYVEVSCKKFFSVFESFLHFVVTTHK